MNVVELLKLNRKLSLHKFLSTTIRSFRISDMQSQTYANEAEVVVPGSFVVLQGIAGDGMANTIDNHPLLKKENDDESNNAEDQHDDDDDDDYQHLFYVNNESSSLPAQTNVLGMTTGILTPALATLSIQPLNLNQHQGQTAVVSGLPPQSKIARNDSFIVVDDDHDEQEEQSAEISPSSALIVPRPSSALSFPDEKAQAIRAWTEQRRKAEEEERSEWLTAQDLRGHAEIHGRAWMAAQLENLWWLNGVDGKLAVMKDVPQRSSRGVILRTVTASLPPGCTVVGTELICLNTDTLEPVKMQRSFNKDAFEYPHGRAGWLQLLKLVSPVDGWVVLSIDGCSLLGPGLPSLYVDPQVWMWRVTCAVGAFVREGLEFESKHFETLPYGSHFRVTRKMVNAQGLNRLKIHAVVDDEDTSHVVEGWISETLNPLSGQQGPIAQPVPFPVPALYKVTLPQGAVIRSGVELSSPHVGQAPVGTILSIVGRSFSEHPQDRCIERLRLAGDGGWISVRLCEDPPHDEMVVQFVGIDSNFDPKFPGAFHLDAQLRVQQEQANSSPQEQADMLGIEETRTGDLSEIGSDSSANSTPVKRIKAEVTRRAPPSQKYADVCLICLTDERNATIIHGETGHICCCLRCARILKQKGDRCPVCRLPIAMVIQHFFA